MGEIDMTSESIRRHTKRKIRSLKAQIDDLRASEFPHEDPREALSFLANAVAGLKSQLDRLPANADASVLREACSDVSLGIMQLLPVLGFILRSTNVRNAFELFDPLKRLTRQLLGPNSKLVLSSEWEFSPMTYPMNITYLPEFVLIGLPASESENALLAPLAGHELGHSIWLKKSIDKMLRPKAETAIRGYLLSNWPSFQKVFDNFRSVSPEDVDSDLELFSVRSRILDFVDAQSTEVFCDLVGCRIFGESFLSAFEYLLAPGIGDSRTLWYPTNIQRVNFVQDAMSKMGLPLSRRFDQSFDLEAQPSDARAAFLAEVADTVTRTLFSDLYNLASTIVDEAKIPRPDGSAINDIISSFGIGIPADGGYSLSDIIQAGWNSLADEKWRPDLDSRYRSMLLNELVLKSLEVSEYRIRNC